MLLNCYSIYDRKALVYHPPFFQHADGAAVRMLADLVSDVQTSVGRHPGDYVLYKIGAYDDQKGSMIPLTPLLHIIDAQALAPSGPSGPLFELPSPAANVKTGNGKEAQ